MTYARLLAMAQAALGASSCVPFVLPPARVEAGAGLRLHQEHAENETGQTPTAVLRFAIHPFQISDTSAEQLFDVGIGYRSEVPLRNEAYERPLHGPYAEFGLYPVKVPLGRSTSLRWGGYTSADLDFSSTDPLGFGGTLGTLLEVSGTSSGAFADSDEDSSVLGIAHGQWAVGVFANTSLRDVRGDFSQGIAAGLSVRIPFMAGVMCCVWPSSSADENAKSERTPERHEHKRRERKRRDYRRAEPRRTR